MRGRLLEWWRILGGEGGYEVQVKKGGKRKRW